MIANLEDLKARILRQNIQKFVIYPLGKSTDAVRQKGNCESYTDEDSIENKLLRLESFWQEEATGGGGRYELVETAKTSDTSQFAFTIYPERQMQPQQQPQIIYQQQPQVGQIPEGYMNIREVETKLENERLKLRLEALESEVKDLRKENQSLATPTADFFKQITPFVQPILSGLLRRPTAQIGSLDQPQQQQDSEVDLDITEEEFQQLCAALRKWKEADSDYLKIIVALSDFTNDSMYSSAKSFVLNNQKS